jgi:hypothetical protein
MAVKSQRMALARLIPAGNDGYRFDLVARAVPILHIVHNLGVPLAEALYSLAAQLGQPDGAIQP